ncbi:class I SAM-dependent methyltransferase [uncultured Aquitalea sp.]|uniref:class I SAM-dependent methyltransferase n=1 Tax=uncultured Aquitalea sp. TaxID=540272 RepID=UPI002600BFCC|nr:class I SAM-dependent methyltransferase [uncultured Aquitalea sp.]
MNRADFDAASYPWIREALRDSNQALRGAEKADFSLLLDETGEFLPGVSAQRSCPMCDQPSASATELFVAHGMHIMRCAACDFIYSREVILPEAERARYRHSQSSQANQALKANEAYAFLEKKKSEYIVSVLEQFAAPGRRLLDVGCSNGALLAEAASRGWQAVGIELGATAVAVCRERGLNVAQGCFPQDLPAGWRDQDVVVLLDVLEHLPEPRQAMSAMTDCLRDGGLLLVQVPNQHSLLLQIEQAGNNNYCHGHWSYFTPVSLQRLMDGAGFDCLRLETYISELDRVQAHDAARVAAAWQAMGGDEPLTAEAMWRRGVGYKIFGVFRRRRGATGLSF